MIVFLIMESYNLLYLYPKLLLSDKTKVYEDRYFPEYKGENQDKMMKMNKIIAVILMVVTAFAFTACGCEKQQEEEASENDQLPEPE